MGDSPIRYLSRDFLSIMADINSDPELVDKPDWWKRIWAGVGDALSMQVNAAANNAYLRTAFTRRAVADLLGLINYPLHPQETATGPVLLYATNAAAFPFTLTLADLVAFTQGSLSSGSRRFEARAGVTFPAVSEAFTVSGSQLVVARQYVTGEKVTVSGGSLPAPLQANTSYYVVADDATHIRLATSPANAYAGSTVTLTTGGSGTVTLRSLSVTMYQQTTVAQYIAGNGDAIAKWQRYGLRDVNVLRDTLAVVINSVNWTRVDNPVLSLPSDPVFRLYFNNDQSSYLKFGDGTYGALPGAFPIYVSYAVGGGASSNVPTANLVNAYGGSDSRIEGCSNPLAMTGGADPETIVNAKEIGPISIAVQQRFITDTDGETLMLAFGGLSLAHVDPNYYGPNSARLLAIATGGGNPSAGLKSAILAYLVPLTLFGSATLVFSDATFVAVTPSVSVHLLPGYSWTTVQGYVSLALRLFFTERGKEIRDYWQANGTAAAVTFINSIWSLSFGAADLSTIGALLSDLVPRNFGDYITLDDLTTFVEANVAGIDYMTVASPAFPMTLGATDITQLSGSPVVAQIP